MRSIHQLVARAGLGLVLCLTLVPTPEAAALCLSTSCGPTSAHPYFGAGGDKCMAVWLNGGGKKSARVIGNNAHFFNPVVSKWSACAPPVSAAANWGPIGSASYLLGDLFHFASSSLPAGCTFQFRPLVGAGSFPATETCVIEGSKGLPVELLAFSAE